MNLEDVKATILEGIFLAVLVVYFFLGSWRSTFITALALPNGLISSFIFMHLLGFSINIISLMSLALVAGLLMDDAIVVRENIFRHYKKGLSPEESAIKGTDEVSLAVIACTTTFVAVFIPVAFLDGIVGQFFREFGITVCIAMIISLYDALTIAPMLSAYIASPHNKVKKAKGAFAQKIANIWHMLTLNWFEKLFNTTLKYYEVAIRWIVKNKKKTICTALAFFALSMVMLRQIPVDFVPRGENGEFSVAIETPPGSSLERTSEICVEIERIIMAMPEVEFAVTSIGNVDRELNVADIYVRLVPFRQRRYSTEQVKGNVRRALAEQIGADTIISVNDVGGFDAQRPFQLLLFSRDISQLDKLSKSLIERFRHIPGMVDISTNFRIGSPEFQIHLDPLRLKRLGVNSTAAGEELRTMVEGTTPAVFRRNMLEHDIRVRFKDPQRSIADNFYDLYVRNINNRRVRLSRVATIEEAEGPTKIFRRNRARFIDIAANLEQGTTLGEVQREVQRIMDEHRADPANADLWRNVTYQYGGNVEEMERMQASLIFAFMLSLIFIYMALASLYESVITPFTIMASLPLAAVGGVAALWAFNISLDMFTMIGFIMLLGIVGKNSIIFVDYIQRLLASGMEMSEAVITAGKVRLRPILMTSISLAAGVLPTALAISEVRRFRQGMGIVIIGGVLSSMALTLLVIPAIFEYMERLRLFFRRKFGLPAKRKIDVELEAQTALDRA